MRPRIRMRGTKITPKNLEREMLERARRLADNPSLLMPKCKSDCKRCEFEGLIKKMETIAKHRDDSNRLTAMAGWGDQLVRAYAATISLAAAGKIPYLATVKLPIGDVSYALRGKVDKEKLIGVQYFDDPDLRLLAFWDIAEKRGLHLYSSSTEFVCSSDGPAAPESYVREMIASAPYRLDQQNACAHAGGSLNLVVRWKSADVTITVCGDCAGDSNLLHHLASRIAARDTMDDFSFEVEHKMTCRSDCEGCRADEGHVMSPGLREDYLKGEIDDSTLVDRYLKGKLSAVRSSGESVFVAGNECYGGDWRSFIEHIRGSEAEKRALLGLLEAKPMSIVSRSDQAGRIIADLWAEHGQDLLSRVASPTVMARIKRREGELSPSQMVQEADRLERAHGIHSSLPEYARLGEVGGLADRLARLYKTEGKGAVSRAIEKERQREHRLRAVAYGFLLAVGESEGKSWQFTKEETDFGQYLSQFASRLVSSEGEEYHETLEVLIQASGSAEVIERK